MPVMKSFAVIGAVAAFSSVASAADFTFVASKSEMETRTGLERTLARIDRAAEAACNVGKSREFKRIVTSRKCQADVTAHILAEINHPQLTAAYREAATFAAR